MENELLLHLLAPFLDDRGRLTAFPAKRKKKLPALLYLAETFSPGVMYSEREVNDLLDTWHTFRDPATLRRELYDYRLLDRRADGSAYWVKTPLPTLPELEALL